MAQLVGQDVVVDGQQPAQILAVGLAVKSLHALDERVDFVTILEEAVPDQLLGPAENQAGNLVEVVLGMVLRSPERTALVLYGDGLDVRPGVRCQLQAAGGVCA
jgi:hypothetical protein